MLDKQDIEISVTLLNYVCDNRTHFDGVVLSPQIRICARIK
jgi:hypothetical protein